jgi:DNA-binding SARP family transcriptional activator
MQALQPFLFHGPDFLMAVLASWMGLSLLVRAPRDRTNQAFAWFCLNLALYGLTAMLPLLTTDSGSQHAFDRAQIIATVLTPPAFLHFVVMLLADGKVKPLRRGLLGLSYATGAMLAFYTLLAPGEALTFGQEVPLGGYWREPSLATPETPLLYWAWVAQRALPLLVAVGFMWIDYRQALDDARERILRRIIVLTVLTGVVGALAGIVARTLPPQHTPDLVLIGAHALSRTLIVVALIGLAYAVIAYRALLPPRIARRAFFYSIAGSLLTAFYVCLLLLLEGWFREWLQLTGGLPLVTIFAVVALVASIGPLSEWFRGELDRRFYRREFDYGRLVHTLSDDVFRHGSLNDQLQTTLAAVCRVLGVRDGLIMVISAEGLTVHAQHGQVEVPPQLPHVMPPRKLMILEEAWELWPPAQFLLPLCGGEECFGLMALGPRRFEQSLTTVEHGLLDYLSNYLALVISHTRAREEQQQVMAHLAQQSEEIETKKEELARQTVEATRRRETTVPVSDGLYVYALGALRVERNGQAISRWGGDKAGTHQAEALFAFLLDRLGRGITKEEAIEIIWPDAELEDTKKADNAFHRTLTALRRTLEPDLKHASKSRIIQYHHGRYWLEPGVIAWSDTHAFTTAVEQGITHFHQGHQTDALQDLRQAVQLYRGDYMDDCPFFGDSSYVEEQREMLLSRYIQAQLTLSVLYEAQGRLGEATSVYQEAEVAARRVQLLNPDYTQDVEEQRELLRTRFAV